MTERPLGETDSPAAVLVFSMPSDKAIIAKDAKNYREAKLRGFHHGVTENTGLTENCLEGRVFLAVLATWRCELFSLLSRTTEHHLSTKDHKGSRRPLGAVFGQSTGIFLNDLNR